MTFLSIKDDTCEALRLLRHKGESDDALIKRIVELARCYMILFGMEDVDARADLQRIEVQGSGMGGPSGLDWIEFGPGITEDMSITGDLYSSCPKCGAMDTEYLGTEAMDPKFKCKKCGNVFFPQIKFFTSIKPELSK